MAKSAKQLREELQPIANEIQKHRDKISADDYKFDAADETAWKRMNDDYNAKMALIRQVEAADDILKQRNDPEGDPEPQRQLRQRPGGADPNVRTGGPITLQERELAIQGTLARWLGGIPSERLSAEHRSAMTRCKAGALVRMHAGDLVIRLADADNNLQALQRSMRYDRGHASDPRSRALAFGAGAGNVGVLGPDGFIAALEVNMLAHGPMLQIADIWRTTDGRPVSGPNVDDTGNEGDIVGEAASVSATQDPTFGEQTWNAYKLRSKKVVYSTEAEEDSVFNLPQILGEICGQRIGRGANRYLTTGTGTSQPEGVVIGSGLGVTAASATAFTADEVIQLFHSVDPAYRMNAVFMLHDTTLSYIRQMKHTDGTYIYKFAEGGNNTIYGRPFQVNNHMASARTTGQKLVLFGDFSRMKVRQVREIRLRRYVELHGDNDQDAIQAFLRLDGKIQNSGTAPIKRLQLA